MAWREVDPMDERTRFGLKATREATTVAARCREFGSSRKTGYKWLARYRAQGLDGLRELSRRPRASPTQVPAAVEALVLRERHRHRTWGPKKLQAVLATKHGVAPVPAVSTIGNRLTRHGLTRKTRRRRPVSAPDRRTRTAATHPNAVWAADVKGWFRTRDGQRCDPLTISDLASRSVLAGRIVAGPRSDQVRPVVRQVFRRFGRPDVFRVDNGPPLGARGVWGSRTSAPGGSSWGSGSSSLSRGTPSRTGRMNGGTGR